MKVFVAPWDARIDTVISPIPPVLEPAGEAGRKIEGGGGCAVEGLLATPRRTSLDTFLTDVAGIGKVRCGEKRRLPEVLTPEGSDVVKRSFCAYSPARVDFAGRSAAACARVQ